MKRWINKINENISAVKQYAWVDRVLIIDESQRRRVLKDFSYTEFELEIDQWSEENIRATADLREA